MSEHKPKRIRATSRNSKKNTETLPLPAVTNNQLPAEPLKPLEHLTRIPDAQAQSMAESIKDGPHSQIPISPADKDVITSGIALLSISKSIEGLEKRMKYQEHIHRDVQEDGSVRHLINIMPTVIIAAFTGCVIGFAISIYKGKKIL